MREGSIWIIIYAIAWIMFYFVLYKKIKKFGISSLIILTYIIYAICSLLLYNSNVLSGNYRTLELFPYIYLFGMLVLSLLPAIQYDREQIIKIKSPNTFVLNGFSILFILISIILLPNYLSSIQKGINLIIFDPYGGADLYKDTHDIGAVKRTFMDIPFVIFSMFSYIAVLVFFYYLTIPKSNKTLMFGLSISMIVNLLAPISRGLRTETVLMLFAIVSSFFLMKKWIPEKRRKKISLVGISLISGVVFLLVVLTISRIVSRDIDVRGSMVEYVGQANLNFNNYGLDAGGIRNGDRTCRIFKEIMMFDNVPNGPLQRRSKYQNLYIDDYYFYTFVGDFTIDFGPIIAVLIFVVTSFFFVKYTKSKHGTLSFSQLLILYLSILIPLQGGMYLFNYSDGGNYTLIAFAFMATAFSSFNKPVRIR